MVIAPTWSMGNPPWTVRLSLAAGFPRPWTRRLRHGWDQSILKSDFELLTFLKRDIREILYFELQKWDSLFWTAAVRLWLLRWGTAPWRRRLDVRRAWMEWAERWVRQMLDFDEDDLCKTYFCKQGSQIGIKLWQQNHIKSKILISYHFEEVLSLFFVLMHLVGPEMTRVALLIPREGK